MDLTHLEEAFNNIFNALYNIDYYILISNLNTINLFIDISNINKHFIMMNYDNFILLKKLLKIGNNKFTSSENAYIKQYMNIYSYINKIIENAKSNL